MNREQLLQEIEKVFGPGCASICKERARQIEVEQFLPSIDRRSYQDGQLASAAACYAMPGYRREQGPLGVPLMWPWDNMWWKPTPDTRNRELEKAGALVAAEIDVLTDNPVKEPFKGCGEPATLCGCMSKEDCVQNNVQLNFREDLELTKEQRYAAQQLAKLQYEDIVETKRDMQYIQKRYNDLCKNEKIPWGYFVRKLPHPPRYSVTAFLKKLFDDVEAGHMVIPMEDKTT